MDSATAARLLALNRDFYDRFGASFSAARRRLQPGVKRMLESLAGTENILDLGCGNGELARALARRGHRGSYLGLDFSLPLLREAESQPEGFSARFLQVDLTSPALSNVITRSRIDGFDVVFCFSVLHHIPGDDLRSAILKTVHDLLVNGGRFILSNWQFLNSRRLKARVQPWNTIGRSEGDVDEGDYLLDWRSGGTGLRYIHHFSEDEMSRLARRSGFLVKESFLSDGDGGRLGLYQVWEKD